jgi:multiple antibiotic resistance protein
VAALIIGVFALFGQQILLYLGIRLPSLEAAGGLLLLVVALSTLRRGRGPVRREPGQHRLRAARYAAAGRAGRDRGDHGVHARGQHGARAGRVALGLAGVLVVLWLTLRFAGVVRRLLGQPGIELVTRISGLLLTAIAVQLVADAVREFIREGV